MSIPAISSTTSSSHPVKVSVFPLNHLPSNIIQKIGEMEPQASNINKRFQETIKERSLASARAGVQEARLLEAAPTHSAGPNLLEAATIVNKKIEALIKAGTIFLKYDFLDEAFRTVDIDLNMNNDINYLLRSKNDQEFFLLSVIRRYLEKEMVEDALRVVDGMSQKSSKALLLDPILCWLVSRGDLEKALSHEKRMTPSKFASDCFYQKFVRILINQKKWKQARDVADKMESNGSKDMAYGEIINALLLNNLVDDAESLLHKISIGSTRDQCLQNIIKKLLEKDQKKLLEEGQDFQMAYWNRIDSLASMIQDQFKKGETYHMISPKEVQFSETYKYGLNLTQQVESCVKQRLYPLAKEIADSIEHRRLKSEALDKIRKKVSEEVEYVCYRIATYSYLSPQEKACKCKIERDKLLAYNS